MMRITSVHSPGHSDMALPMDHVHSRTAECDSPPRAFDAAHIVDPDNMRPETTSTVTVNMTANTTTPTNTTSALVGARKRKALRVIKHQVAVAVTPREDLAEMKSVAVSMDQQSVVSDSGSRRGTPDSDPHYSNDGDDASSLSGTSGSPRSHACPLCGKLLSSGSSLDRHMLVHSGERPFKCKHCGAAFNTNGNMHRHTRTHCAALKEQSSSATALPTPIHHQHHNNESDNDSDHSHSSYHSEASSTGKRRKRQSSDEEFSASLDLRQPPKSTVHKYEEDDEAEIECLRSCSAAEKSSKEAFFSVLDLQLGQSPRQGSLNGSNRSANGWTPQPPMSPAMLSLSAQKIEDDLLSHEEDDPFSAHLREMKMRGEFPCKLCTAIFPNLRALKGHNRVHLTHPPYRCNLCPVVSSDKGALIRHMRTHNGERPYECKLCQFAFTTKANCERHLRNRHGQNTRDMLKAAIIYHANEDSTLINKPASSVSPEYRYSRSNKSDDLGSSGFLPSSDDQRPHPFSSLMHAFSLANEFQQQQSRATQYDDDEEDMEVERQLRRRERQELEEEEEDLDEEEEEDFQDAPLDLTVDVLDLSKKRQANGCPPPKTPSSHYTSQPTSVNETASAPASSQTPLHISPPSGLTPSSLFMPSLPYFASPFGHHPLPFFYNPSPFPGLEANTSSEENSRYPANLDLSALALAAAHHDVLRQAQQHQMATESGLLMPVSSANVIHSTPIANSHSQSSVSASNPKSHLKSRTAEEDDKNAPVKMVIKNGVLMKKQKQRRYRTERPFGCEHCTARFTLRSNMERHIKQQHPDVWTTRPRGARRLAAVPASLLEMTPDSSSSTEVSRKEASSAVLAHTKQAISDQVRQAITQQLKMKREHKEEEKKHGADDMEDEDEEELEEDGELVIDEEKETAAASTTDVVSSTVPHPKQPSSGGSHREEDLASVDKLLINAVAHNFQHYFQRNSEEMGEESGEHDTGAEDTECTSSEHSGSDESTSHRGEQDSSKPPKKKSAYSSAPHRVACPFCARKFPWTSSLRRHILTHTGQKPFKCPQCPLWFTTKSNCDRHLLRKHGNNNDYASAARSVPDRPYKCDLCPSSTFSSSDNLKKHQDSKHQHYCGGSEGGSSGSRTTSPTTSLLADEEGDAIMH